MSHALETGEPHTPAVSTGQSYNVRDIAHYILQPTYYSTQLSVLRLYTVSSLKAKEHNLVLIIFVMVTLHHFVVITSSLSINYILKCLVSARAGPVN